MYVILLLIFCVVCEFGEIHTGVSNQERLPQEWNELVIFVNQKFGHFERLMNIKDGHIAQLKSELQNQNAEMMQLKQDVRLLQLMNSKHAGIQGPASPTLESTSDVVANLEDINSSNLFTSRENTHRTKFIANESLTSDKRHDYTNTSADGISIIQREDIQNPHDAQLGTPSLDDYKPQWTSSKTFRHRRVHLKDTEVQGFKQKRVATEQTIAFHASLSHTVDASPHSTVVFDQEQLDQGDGYNPLDGIYSAPESGTYVITWTLMADRHASFQSQLIVNGVALGNSFTDADEVGDLHQTSATTVLALSKGDHVFVRVGHIARGKISTEVSNPTFSGWKTS